MPNIDIFQTATLDSGTMVSRVSEVAKDSDDDDDEKEGGSKGRERLDDNQLFEACGGMTAHKWVMIRFVHFSSSIAPKNGPLVQLIV